MRTPIIHYHTLYDNHKLSIFLLNLARTYYYIAFVYKKQKKKITWSNIIRSKCLYAYMLKQQTKIYSVQDRI